MLYCINSDRNQHPYLNSAPGFLRMGSSLACTVDSVRTDSGSLKAIGRFERTRLFRHSDSI